MIWVRIEIGGETYAPDEGHNENVIWQWHTNVEVWSYVIRHQSQLEGYCYVFSVFLS
jgi:hypothetical protein